MFVISASRTRVAGRAVSLGLYHSRNRADKACDPLRILFCGSDKFSITALRALDQERRVNPSLIRSIDVLYRRGKRAGRGLKTVRHVPLSTLPQELGLPQHAVETLRDWQPPAYINLVIAVSFGLLIPADVINVAKYGGLNVHPSLLPDLRGAAPIHYTLLRERRHTGVTVQTLHPTRFDQGDVLAQTPFPWLHVPPQSTVPSLGAMLAAEGAHLLLSTLRNKLFVQPRNLARPLSQEQMAILTRNTGPEQAPKITSEVRRIRWHDCSGEKVVMQNRILGDLWDTETYARLLYRSVMDSTGLIEVLDNQDCVDEESSKRLIYHELGLLDSTEDTPVTGRGVKLLEDMLIFTTSDGHQVCCKDCTIEGGRKGHGIREMWKSVRAIGRGKSAGSPKMIEEIQVA